MKKALILILITALALSVAGCGNKPQDETLENTDTSSEGVTAVPEQEKIDVSKLPKKEEGKKTVEEDFAELPDMLEGQHVSDNFTMIVTFYFDGDKAINGYVTGIYKDVAQAKSVYDSYLKNEEYYANVEREGGKITYTNTEASFEAYKDKSKADVKASLIESGFEITKE